MLGLALRSSICSPIRTSIRSPSGTCSRAIAVTALLITAAVMRRNVLLVLTEQRCEKLLFRQRTCRLADLQASSAAQPGSRSLARAAHGSSLHSRAQLAARQREGKNKDGIEGQKHTEGGKRQGLPSTSERCCWIGARTGDSVPRAGAQQEQKWTIKWTIH